MNPHGIKLQSPCQHPWQAKKRPYRFVLKRFFALFIQQEKNRIRDKTVSL
jgi:hypothetical protein